MARRSRVKGYDEINVTPLLDLAFTLLLIFVIMATAAVQGITMDLPSASAGAELGTPKTRSISVDRQGQVFLDTIPVSLAELDARVREIVARGDRVPFIVRGDAEVAYSRVIDVLDLLRGNAVEEVGLVTHRRRGG